MQEINPIPIIAIDGTSSSGKGTIASLLAKKLNFHYLNSGALYRLSAHLAVVGNIDITNKEPSNMDAIVALLIQEKDFISFSGKEVHHRGQDIWPLLASQEMGNMAAIIAPYPPLREAIHHFQRTKIMNPGLVAEGRDMTTVVFTDARVKIYLDASVEARARRRLRDEERRNSGKTYEMLCQELKERDDKDKTRPVGALRLSDDAFYIDTSMMTIEEVLQECLSWCKERGLAQQQCDHIQTRT